MNINNGQVVIGKNRIHIYEVYPLNFTEGELIEESIFQKYLSFIKGITKNIQIIIKIEELNLTENITLITKNNAYQNNSNVNKLVNDFEIWVRAYLSSEKIYIKKFYMVVSECQECGIRNMLEILKDMGVSTKEIIKKSEVYELIKECICK